MNEKQLSSGQEAVESLIAATENMWIWLELIDI